VNIRPHHVDRSSADRTLEVSAAAVERTSHDEIDEIDEILDCALRRWSGALDRLR
jgi:hypothetical protein